MSERPIIGLVGRKRVGKDTVAARLVEAHGFVQMAFADRLRSALLAVDPIIGDDPDYGGMWTRPGLRLAELIEVDGWETAKTHPEVRRLLQTYGVAARELVPDIWIRPVVADAVLEPRPVVISDVRFTNEADMVERHGGLLVRVQRSGLDMRDTHVSETQLDDRVTWRTIDNSGTLDELKEQVDALIVDLN